MRVCVCFGVYRAHVNSQTAGRGRSLGCVRTDQNLRSPRRTIKNVYLKFGVWNTRTRGAGEKGCLMTTVVGCNFFFLCVRPCPPRSVFAWLVGNSVATRPGTTTRHVDVSWEITRSRLSRSFFSGWEWVGGWLCAPEQSTETRVIR